MTEKLICIDGEASLSEAIQVFNKHNIGRLVVNIDGVPMGLLSKADVLHELAIY